MASNTEQPTWHPVVKARSEPVLKLLNTLTRSKTEFVPVDGKLVKWYNCGPTVYDHAHLGHARNYVSQDIMRRVMTDYFKYDVFFVMNITDIEDKIIQSARKKYLFHEFLSQHASITVDLLARIHADWNQYFQDHLEPHLSTEYHVIPTDQSFSHWKLLVQKFQDDKDFRIASLRKSEKFELNLKQLKATQIAIENAQTKLNSDQNGIESASELLISSYDILTYTLDEKLKSTVSPHIQKLSKEHSSFWEARFMEDMRALKVMPPDLITRVTEYVPENVRFIQKIMDRRFAYEMAGSVYFDTRAFDGAKIHGNNVDDQELKHWYLKLEPWSKNNKDKADEGEGTLADKQSTKRNNADFALWKASRPGEPSWPSPWGRGRPGWHIECSVMASEVFGNNLDIHSGGEDLTFPHHDNELAQSEAHHDCKQWVNYFLHTGHLHIEGLKMSKSLKNFITIQEILQRYTARQLRLAFMSQLWSSKMDFQESIMTGEIKSWEITFDNFFTLVGALMQQEQRLDLGETISHNFNGPERALLKQLFESQHSFRAALSDSFNLPEALDILLRLVSKSNVYINSQKSSKSPVNLEIILRIAMWVTKMLRMFGLGEGSDNGGVGWGTATRSDSSEGSFNREEQVMPYLRVMSTFRDDIRLAAMNNTTSLKKILVLCDELRDEALVPLGVALDDQEDGRALIKFVAPELLIKARNEKKAQTDEKAQRRAANQAAEQEKKRVQMEKGKQSPQEMFKGPETEYGSWDEHGVPRSMLDGSELSKNAAKKVRTQWDQQTKRHAEYLKWKEDSNIT